MSGWEHLARVAGRWDEQADHHLHLDADYLSVPMGSTLIFLWSFKHVPSLLSKWMLPQLQFWKVIYQFIFLPLYLRKSNDLGIAFS